jgi:hypothetical protein
MRRRAVLASVAIVALLPLAAGALEVAGVTFPATVEAGGKTLTLNGAGVRTRFLFKVYAIGLYLEQPGTDGRAILAADQVRRADLHMLRSVPAAEMGEAIATAINANAGGDAARLQDRVDRLKAMFPSADKGEVITLTYVPGTGTVVAAKGRNVGTIEGKDFADALFGAWIGAAPVSDSLKQDLLAGA